MGHPFLADEAQVIHDNYLGELPALARSVAGEVSLLKRGFEGIDAQAQEIIDAALGRASKAHATRLINIDVLMSGIVSKTELIAKRSRGRALKGTVASVRKDGQRLTVISTLLRQNIGHALVMRDALRELENAVQKLARFYTGRMARG